MTLTARDHGIDYEELASPYTGLAVMIFVQADADLRRLGSMEKMISHEQTVRKSEVIGFFRSRWAKFLAEAVGLDAEILEEYLEVALETYNNS